MKSKQGPDKEIHIRKNVAGGTTGALLGAAVGGPVGALVGGVIGVAIGNAAETGKFAKSVSSKAKTSKPIAHAKAALKKPTQRARRSIKAPTNAKPQRATPSSSRRLKGKSKS